MKPIKIVSVDTPNFLRENAQAIENSLNEEEVDHAQLLSLMEIRDELIQHYLSNTPTEQLNRTTIEHEIAVNEQLSNLLEPDLQQTKDELRGLVKGLKAVKKYRK